MAEPLDPRLLRYLNDEASPEEQRELLEEAMREPELFDLLMLDAEIRETASSLRHTTPLVAPLPTRPRWGTGARIGWALAAAASVAMAVALVWRRPEPAPTVVNSPIASASETPALLQPPAAIAKPVFLVSALVDRTVGPAPAFRTPSSESRDPRAAGAVASLDGDSATIDVGSLDGLLSGSRVSLDSVGGPVDVRVTSVSRERARVSLNGATVVVGAIVRVGPSDQIEALADQLKAALARGADETASAVARRLRAAEGMAQADAASRRTAAWALASFAHRRGDFEEAAAQYQQVVAAFQATPGMTVADRADVLNALGAALASSRRLDAAEAALLEAEAAAAGDLPLTAGRVSSNRGSIAAMRGDRAAAEQHYATALRWLSKANGTTDARRTVERNLDMLKGAR